MICMCAMMPLRFGALATSVAAAENEDAGSNASITTRMQAVQHGTLLNATRPRRCPIRCAPGSLVPSWRCSRERASRPARLPLPHPQPLRCPAPPSSPGPRLWKASRTSSSKLPSWRQSGGRLHQGNSIGGQTCPLIGVGLAVHVTLATPAILHSRSLDSTGQLQSSEAAGQLRHRRQVHWMLPSRSKGEPECPQARQPSQRRHSVFSVLILTLQNGEPAGIVHSSTRVSTRSYQSLPCKS